MGRFAILAQMTGFWLGERSGELAVDDYDGSLHHCRVVEWRDNVVSQRVARVLIEPPIRFGESAVIGRAEIHPLRPGEDLAAEGPIPVSVIGLDEQGQHTVRLKPGWVAVAPGLLPATPDEQFRSRLERVATWLRAGKPSNPELERWSGTMVDAYRRGSLPSWQAAELENVSGWDWGMPRWWEILQGYVDREGTARVPVDHHEQGRPLGTWVLVTRSQRNRLPASLVSFLEALPGWTWEGDG